jgi:uncharacterized protein YdbL (DUF1318 family)
MNRFKYLLILMTLASALVMAPLSTSFAGGLSASEVSQYKQAKGAGKLVEQSSGYLKPGSGASQSLVGLMSRINQLRKEKYQGIANRNKIPIQAVEKAAGKKLSGR